MGKGLGFLIGALAVLVMLFNACNNSFLAFNPQSSMAANSLACFFVIEDEFQKGYYPFLSKNCAACHRSGGSGNGAFADSDFGLAFEQFMLRSSQRVKTRALNPNHQAPYTGPQHSSALNQIESDWQVAYVEYEACMASAEDPEPGSGGADEENPLTGKSKIFTIKKVIEAGEESRTLAWDLGTEVEAVSMANFPGARLELDVRLMKSSTGDPAYIFSQPRLFAGDQALHLKLIEVSINGSLIASATTFKGVDRRVPAGESRDLLATSSMVVPFEVAATDEISLGIGSIQVVDFDPPSFAELTAAGGVFAQNCFSCHSGNNLEGSLDLSSRDEIISGFMVSPYNIEQSEIYKRMTDTANPMPKSGVLPEDQLKQVRDWINDGAPE